jgi:hypothetical protein
MHTRYIAESQISASLDWMLSCGHFSLVIGLAEQQGPERVQLCLRHCVERKGSAHALTQYLQYAFENGTVATLYARRRTALGRQALALERCGGDAERAPCEALEDVVDAKALRLRELVESAEFGEGLASDQQSAAYLELPPDVPVHFIDNCADLGRAVSAILASGCTAIGFDVENRCSRGVFGSDAEAATLQLAYLARDGRSSAVYVLDMIALCGTDGLPPSPHGLGAAIVDTAQANAARVSRETDRQLRRLFSNPALVKVGFASSGDLKMLASSYPTLESFHPYDATADTGVTQHVDIAVECKREMEALAASRASQTPVPDATSEPLQLPGPSHTSKPQVSAPKSLSDVCRLVLGRPLSKRMTMSNWNARPLSSAQISYAALDAWCLVLIWRELRGPAAGLGESGGKSAHL